jgi:prefoldin subunit 5
MNRGIENQYRELQVQRSATVGPQLFFWPQLKVDARDSPQQLASKAQLLQREIDNATGHIQRVDDEIGRLQQRLALLRRQNDSRASRDLFDAASPPVGPPSRPAPGGASTSGVGDPQAVPLADRPLEEQIEALRETRDQLDLMVQQLRATVATIRGVQGVARGPGGGR